MTLWFSIEVRLLNGRYHGRDENTLPQWPPTPLRLFQAITAGALSGRWPVEDREPTEATLRWLESLGSPNLVLAPKAERLRSYRIAVPNNQADRHLPALTKGAHLDRLLARDKELKVVWPRIVARKPLIYAWPIPQTMRDQAEAARTVVRRLVVLGTGLDHAVADIQISPERPVVLGLISHRPGVSPCAGTLDSLIELHKAKLERLKTGSLRENLPPVRHRRATAAVRTDTHFVFALRTPSNGEDAPLPIEPEATAVLAHAIRLRLAAVVIEALRLHPRTIPETSPEEIERLVIGRGAGPADAERRLRVLPLPSIGHEYSDGLLRRVIISVPSVFPVPSESVRRALSNREVEVGTSPSPLQVRLAPVEIETAQERAMRARYLGPARIWRSVSPVLLPGRRPSRRTARPEVSGTERDETVVRADARRCEDEAILFERALQHAGIDKVTSFRLRREPFGPHQPRADANWRLPASPSDGHRSWLLGRPRIHAEIIFDEPQSGPLLIGDGRYLGLGLMVAERDAFRDVIAFALPANTGIATADGPTLARAARRALMALARNDRGEIPRLFSGHEDDGTRAASGRHEHVFVAADDDDSDGRIDRLIVAAPWACDRSLKPSRGKRRIFEAVVSKLKMLRAGRLGIVALGGPTALADDDPVVGPARIWESRIPYLATRHVGRRKDVNAALVLDITTECERRGLSRPEVEVINFEVIAGGGGISACISLRFATGINGPLLLGRNSHRGGGLFVMRK